jgi:hypothetical protein
MGVESRHIACVYSAPHGRGTKMTEKDIICCYGNYWVFNDKNKYTVFKITNTHSVSDSSYSKTKDGLSIAIERCKYLFGKQSTPDKAQKIT